MIAPALFEAVDAIAARKDLSRAAVISLACAELIERDLEKLSSQTTKTMQTTNRT
jgi:hypothetical protein